VHLTTHGDERRTLLNLIRGLIPAATLATVCGTLVAVFLLDRSTGAAPVQHLYYLPIVVAHLRFRLRAALPLTLAVIALYHAANPEVIGHYGEAALVQIVLFVSVGLVAARLRHDSLRIERLALTDDLTGLHNLRSFERRLQSAFRTCAATGAPVSMIVLDVDRLKAVNDRYGHLAGADAVRTVGRVIAGWVPADGVACRYGGDEFAILLPACSAPDALERADALRALVSATAPVLAGQSFAEGALSISAGVASIVPVRGEALAQGETLFRDADAALYRAKEAGRNRTSLSAVASGQWVS
jgi:diguanylate cyclase (GGDEF)-like protein